MAIFEFEMLVHDLLRQGLVYSEIHTQTGLSKPTISYHAKKLGLGRQAKRRVFLWDQINAEWQGGASKKDLQVRYKIYRDAWDAAVRRGDIAPRPKKHPHARHSLRRLLLSLGTPEICSVCGLSPQWNGNPLRLQLDHIDGNTFNDELSNLRLLCPNCHSQTSTFCGKNTKKAKHARGRGSSGARVKKTPTALTP